MAMQLDFRMYIIRSALTEQADNKKAKGATQLHSIQKINLKKVRVERFDKNVQRYGHLLNNLADYLLSHDML
jgi:hypothetical protein